MEAEKKKGEEEEDEEGAECGVASVARGCVDVTVVSNSIRNAYQ